MSGRPVAIRLLDPPLHEFLPPRAELVRDMAALRGATTAVKKEMAQRYRLAAEDLERCLAALLRCVEELHELNPILGHRGCRVGISHPDIAEAQARAILEASAQVAERGGDPRPCVMIPHVIAEDEVEFYRELVGSVAEEVFVLTGRRIQPAVGVMVETPRCAVVAHRVAAAAEFFSFGTNNLTQLTLGISRDDYTKFKLDYEHGKIFRDDPFETLDEEGVGLLLQMACEEGRRARPSLELGVCGAHANNPRSTPFFVAAGLDYISCSPDNVPVIRLSAAQAAIRAARP